MDNFILDWFENKITGHRVYTIWGKHKNVILVFDLDMKGKPVYNTVTGEWR